MERNCYVDINGACGFYTDVFHGSNHDPVLLLQKSCHPYVGSTNDAFFVKISPRFCCCFQVSLFALVRGEIITIM